MRILLTVPEQNGSSTILGCVDTIPFRPSKELSQEIMEMIDHVWGQFKSISSQKPEYRDSDFISFLVSYELLPSSSFTFIRGDPIKHHVLWG